MELLAKYNVPGPRYTSYPTVPHWDNPPSQAQWKSLVGDSFTSYNDCEGASIYIHLPYCTSLCTFCGCTTRISVNHDVEEPYINAVLKEFELYTQLFDKPLNIKEIHLGGGTPTFFSPSNLERLMGGIFSLAKLDPKASLSFEANPATTTEQHLATLARLGFTRISFGIQDFDPEVQKAIHRVQSFDLVKQAVDHARKLGFESVNFDLLYGLPHQTMASVQDTMDQVNLLRPDRIAFYGYAHVPWVKPAQRSYQEHLPDPKLRYELYSLGKSMLCENGYTEIGMDHFALPHDELTIAYNQSKLHRNFMGYTTQPSKLLIGLGVSAISDTWTGFAQNTKTVEEYLRLLDKGALPIMKGHILSEDDMQVRQLILDIMCQFETNVDHASTAQTDRLLREMEQDGLIQRTNGTLSVTKSGRPFVRNVCMAFDRRLAKSAPDNRLFSSTV